MKVLIKMKGHDNFLADSGEWTVKAEDAHDFKSFLAVLDYRRDHKLENVEAYFCFDDPRYNFVLKIS